MKKSMMFSIFAGGIFLFTSCQEAAKQEPAATSVSTETAKPDMAQIRSDITALENAWAAAINAKDINALMALYADDAVSMPDGGPMLNGKAAIQKKQEMDFAAPASFATIAFETLDVYAQGDVATEVGKTMYKDAAGKVTGSGKYIAVFEKRNGKYLCIREIYNKDSK
ncbi:MAG TPA: nuclear transport factor 2 family protein [Ferruginibacter sp.]|nr:nuclear transport factor 2 family protein [Ferruginibacter sp.]